VTTTSETDLLWTEFSDRLRRFIAHRVANEADAEDILQEVFLRLHQRRDAVRRGDRLGAWLFQVTRNAIVDHYRSPARRRELAAGETLDMTIDVPSDDVDAADAARDAAQAQQELATCLRPMVGHLPDRFREAVTLVDLEGLTQPQAAARLGLSVSGMKSRVQRGRQALRQLLVACCPVQLDSGGRVVDYDRPESACVHCVRQGEGDAVAANCGPD
jgi:RNA polymerase sigma-70 factor (ECF subfamily)